MHTNFKNATNVILRFGNKLGNVLYIELSYPNISLQTYAAISPQRTLEKHIMSISGKKEKSPMYSNCKN